MPQNSNNNQDNTADFFQYYQYFRQPNYDLWKYHCSHYFGQHRRHLCQQSNSDLWQTNHIYFFQSSFCRSLEPSNIDKIYKQISELRKKRDSGKLVVFVGAGVSANSKDENDENNKMLNWTELIKKIAEEIKHPKNYLCREGNEISGFNDMQRHFCLDEMLKIPQHLYNKRQKEYWGFLDDIFGEEQYKKFKPNHIHDIIFDLKPNHIVTTNYDPLLELSKNIKRDAYRVISSDIEMLKNSKEKLQYIIKMHGDYKAIENESKYFVLKEDDYLRYEKTFHMIMTFIKSLLATHTFLFVGYSMGDYNFKQILDWVESLVDETGIKKKDIPNHYIILTEDEPTDENDKRYYENKHVEVIDAVNLPKEWIEENQELDNKYGNRLYAALNAIKEDKSDKYLLKKSNLSELKTQYKVFNNVNYIPYCDLLGIYKWDGKEPNELIESRILDNDNSDHFEFKGFELKLDEDEDKETLEKIRFVEIKKYFTKADINVGGPNENSQTL
ncbi:MAG: SIR2 family protein [Oscillospiraceae bacterium]|jgi:hypothetical protein|nr:SIR2 family protein [Oscillospiraceae bacterium]